jgi:hypothetical protein
MSLLADTSDRASYCLILMLSSSLPTKMCDSSLEGVESKVSLIRRNREYNLHEITASPKSNLFPRLVLAQERTTTPQFC